MGWLLQACLLLVQPALARGGTLGQRWSAARQAADQEYRSAWTQKVSPSRMTLVFLRSKSVRCLILESGGWNVEEANYQCPT